MRNELIWKMFKWRDSRTGFLIHTHDHIHLPSPETLIWEQITLLVQNTTVKNKSDTEDWQKL